MSRAENVADSVNTLLGAYLLRDADGHARALPYNPLDYQVLRFVGGHPRARATDIAASVRVSATTMQSALDRLVRKGLLSKSRSETDGRARLYALSDEGERVRADIRAQDVRNMEAILATLPDDEADTLARLLAKVAGEIAARG